MSPTHHERHSIQEWLNNINERTSDPIPVPRALKPEPAQYQGDPHNVNRHRTRVGLMHRKCDALQTTRKLSGWKVQPIREEPDRLGAQAFCSDHAFGEGGAKNSSFPQPHTGQKRARARESSDSSFLSEGNGIPAGGTKKARFSPRGKLRGYAEHCGFSCSDQDMSRPKEPQRAFERRPRHKTRKDLYDLKSPRRKRKTASVGKTRQTSTRRIRRKSSDTLHQSFASETISKERLTVCNPSYSASFRNITGRSNLYDLGQLKPSGRVGLFKRGRASSPVRKRGLPDLAFSEMQFLHERKRSANNRFQERLEKRERRGKDRDIELHEKISSYFTTAQRTPQEEDLNCDPLSSQDARKRTLTSGDLSDRETPSDTLLAHLTSERVSRSPLGPVSTPKPAFAYHKKHPEPATRPSGDAGSEVTDKFTWSVSARSAAPLDGSTNEDRPRITGSLCHPFPKATVDMEQVNHKSPPDLAADLQCPTRERRNQDGGLTYQKEKQSKCVKNHCGVDYRETCMDFERAPSMEAPTGGSEQSISAIEDQLKLRIPAWLWPRTDRGASHKQHALDPDNHNIETKPEDQPSPFSIAISRECETIPCVPSPENSAEVFPIVSASCGVHLGQRVKSPAELVVSASAPIGTDPDIHQARLVARPKYHPSDTALDEILSLNPPHMWVGSHQHDERNYYSSGGASGLHKGEEEILGRLRPPFPYASRADATRWNLPLSGWGSLEANSNAFYVSSTKQHRPPTQFSADRSIAQPGTQGGSMLTTNSEVFRETLRPRSSIALGPANVDTGEFGRYQQSRKQSTIVKALRIHSPDNIPGNIASVPPEGESFDVSPVDSDRLEIYGPIHGNYCSFQPGYPDAEDPSMENKSHRAYETSRNQGQSFHAIQRKNVLQIRSEDVNSISMATFWRPHRLY